MIRIPQSPLRPRQRRCEPRRRITLSLICLADGRARETSAGHGVWAVKLWRQSDATRSRGGLCGLIMPYCVNLKRVPTAEPGTQRRCRLLKGFVTRRDGVRIGRDQIGPLAGLEPILAALCEPAIGLTSRNPAIGENLRYPGPLCARRTPSRPRQTARRRAGASVSG